MPKATSQLPELKPHPAAAAFPPLTSKDYEALRDDISKNGQRFPIVIHDGLILDGIHRDRACRELSIAPKYEHFTDEGGPDARVAFIVSANMHRRHMTTAQRALMAAKLAPFFAGDAKQALREGAARGGRKSKRGVVQSPEEAAKLAAEGFETLYPEGEPTTGRKRPKKEKEGKAAKVQAAKAFSVSRPTVDQAAKVLASGNEEIIRAVEKGDMTLPKAITEAGLAPIRELQPRREAQACCSKIRRRMMLLPKDGRGEFATIIRDYVETIVPRQAKPSATSKARPSKAATPSVKTSKSKAATTSKAARAKPG